jgi:hypothetical protein
MELVVIDAESVTVPPDELVRLLLVDVPVPYDCEPEVVTEATEPVMVVNDDSLLVSIELVAVPRVVVELGRNVDDRRDRVSVSEAVLVLFEPLVRDDDAGSGPDPDLELVEVEISDPDLDISLVDVRAVPDAEVAPVADARVLVSLRDGLVDVKTTEPEPGTDSGTATDAPELIDPVNEIPLTDDLMLVTVTFAESLDIRLEGAIVLLVFEKVIELIGSGRPA